MIDILLKESVNLGKQEITLVLIIKNLSIKSKWKITILLINLYLHYIVMLIMVI